MVSPTPNIDHYLSLPWKFTFEWSEKDKVFFARVDGLHCFSEGETMEEAQKMIQEALKAHIESYLEDGIEPPKP